MTSLMKSKVPSRKDLQSLLSQVSFTPSKDLHWKEAAKTPSPEYHLLSAKILIARAEQLLEGTIVATDDDTLDLLIVQAQRHLLLFRHYNGSN